MIFLASWDLECARHDARQGSRPSRFPCECILIPLGYRDTRAPPDNFSNNAESQSANSCSGDVSWTTNLSAIPWMSPNSNSSYMVAETLPNRLSGDYQRHGLVNAAPGHSETGHLGNGNPRNSSLSCSSIDSESSQSSLPTPISLLNYQATVDSWEQNQGPDWDVADASLESDPKCSVIYEDEGIQNTDRMSWTSTAEPNLSLKQFRPALRSGARQNSSPQLNPRCEISKWSDNAVN